MIETGVAGRVFTILHRSPDLRLGAVDCDHAGRRDRGAHSAAGAVPSISPPNVSVSCIYPGASAADVAGSVAAPIEQQVNGVEGMLYMSSSCTNDGAYSLTVTFQQGVDLNMAQVLVQNRVSLALPSLPDVIKQTGVRVQQTYARRADGPLDHFAQPPLRPALSEQLRPDADPRRTAPR